MRRTLLGLVLLLLLTAAAVPAPTEPPIRASLAPASVPAARPPGAAQRAVAPDLPPGPPAAGLRAVPRLLVRTLRPVRAHTGRSAFYLVVQELEAGQTLPYVASREGWVLVATPNGGFGWVAGTEVELADPDGFGVTYTLRPDRWEIRAPNGAQAEVTRVGTGTMRVLFTWTGTGTEAKVVAPDSATVAVLAAMDGPVPGAALEVGEGGIAALSLTPSGLLIDTELAPLPRVVASSGGRVELEFRPALSGVEATATGWRFRVRGDLRPVLRPEGQELVLDLPGAVLAPWYGAAPSGVTVAEVAPEAGGSQAQPASATAAIPTRLALGGLRLRLPAVPAGASAPAPAQPSGPQPGTPPHALYRPEPGVLELRFLRPGLAGKLVYLDPGHGGEETGAAGAAGLVEKDLNLSVALRLRTLLEREGARVIIARAADTRSLAPERESALRTYSERTRADLEHRVATANQYGADLYLSIHGNGGPPGDRGIETYWSVANMNAARSRRLAELLQAEMLAALRFPDRGVKQRGFHVIRYPDAPAALVEMGFLTHPAEERVLSTPATHQMLAEALVRALQQFFSTAGS